MSYPAHIPQVIAVEVPRPHVVKVVFDDDLVRELEFRVPKRSGGRRNRPASFRGACDEEFRLDSSRSESVFAPLSDSAFFASVFVDHGTLAWPTGVDLDPVVLHGDANASGFEHFTFIDQYVRQPSG